MSVYKEGYYAVKLIAQRSKQIFPDACDYGAPVKKGDELWNWSKQLADWYGVKGTRKAEHYDTGYSCTQHILLMDE